jgi:hypothetical protein
MLRKLSSLSRTLLILEKYFLPMQQSVLYDDILATCHEVSTHLGDDVKDWLKAWCTDGRISLLNLGAG